MTRGVERLSQRRLNRALLARQHLLERTERPITRVLEDIGGLQTQYAPSGYIGLWTRLVDFRRAALSDALSSRDVIQATLMRVTIHMVSAADYWPLTIGIRRARREAFARVTRREIGSMDMPAAARAVREELASGPLRMDELTQRLVERGFHPRAAGWAGQWIDLVRVPPSGTWERRRADLYGLAVDWLPDPSDLTEQQGMVHVVRRYLGGFGPARPAEIANWAGVPVTAVDAALGELELARFEDEHGNELVDLLDAPLPEEDTPAPVRFLPTWDATLLVHARRTQILPESLRPLVFNTRTPHSTGTFLVDGQVAGTWRYEKGRVVAQSFQALPRGVARDVEDEAQRLTAFHR